MIILFDKINSTPKPFTLEVDNITLEGTLAKSGYHKVSLRSSINGDVKLACDRCGEAYTYTFNHNLNLSLTDLISEDKVDLDIIEFLDGKIDILSILNGEINRVKTSYHYCINCEDNDEDFEMEF